MENKIVVVGEEDFVLGFEVVGIEAFRVTVLEDLMKKKDEIGIIIISSKDYEGLSIKLKNQIDKAIKPIVIILSSDDIKGSNLREQIVKALGVDLLK